MAQSRTVPGSTGPDPALQATRRLRHRLCLAADQELGTVEEFYFDEATWRVLFIVVNSEGRLRYDRVLISPVAVGEFDANRGTVAIELTAGQIRNSPSLHACRPITGDDNAGDAGDRPCGLSDREITALACIPLERLRGRQEYGPPRTVPGHGCRNYMCSSNDARDCAIRTRDGDLGRLQDFIVDTRYWTIRYAELAIPDRYRSCTRHVLVSPAWIQHLDWERHWVNIDLERTVVRNAPAFDPARGISRTYEARLSEYFHHRARRQ